MQTPHVYVVREIEKQYAVYPLDSELMRFYSSEQDAIRHALFMLRWLGHSGDPKMQRIGSELRVSFDKYSSDPYRQFVM